MADYPAGSPSSIKVHDLDTSDRPREKAITQGIRSLSNAELLAIIFGSGLPGESVIDMSRRVLRDNDNDLGQLSLLSIQETTAKYHGVGPAKAVALAAAFELGSRCQRDLQKINQRSPIQGSESVYKIMRPVMERLTVEEFHVLHISRSNRVMFDELISRGGTASTVVDIKLIIKSAINRLSASIILVHNHPSGTLHPSSQDDNITRRIKAAAEMMDIRLLDHVIISPTGFYSYSDNGRL